MHSKLKCGVLIGIIIMVISMGPINAEQKQMRISPRLFVPVLKERLVKGQGITWEIQAQGGELHLYIITQREWNNYTLDKETWKHHYYEQGVGNSIGSFIIPFNDFWYLVLGNEHWKEVTEVNHTITTITEITTITVPEFPLL